MIANNDSCYRDKRSSETKMQGNRREELKEYFPGKYESSLSTQTKETVDGLGPHLRNK
jgi:hypothetical protein